jgi:hypothetical protein
VFVIIVVEIVQIIPVVEEDFDLTEKTVIHETTIGKRMTTRTEKIEEVLGEYPDGFKEEMDTTPQESNKK